MRVLLLEPPVAQPAGEYGISFKENLGLAYLAAFLRTREHVVEIVSAPALGLSTPGLAAAIDDFGPDAIGASLPFTDELASGLACLACLADEFAAIPIFAGGHAVSADPNAGIKAVPSLTAIVHGEGEETFGEVLDRLNTGRDLAGVAGISFLSPSGLVRTAQRPVLADLDRLPFPARDTARGALARGKHLNELYVAGSRGCPYRCSFCDIKTFYANSQRISWRGRSATNIVAELRDLVGEFGTTPTYCFVDDQFIGPGRAGKRQTTEFAETLRGSGLGLHFEITCRADSVDRDTFSVLKAAGLSGVYLGLDSGSDEALGRFQKDTTVDRSLRAVELLRDLGIAVDFGFIMFDPWTTVDDLRKNLAFLGHLVGLGLPLHPAVLRSQLKLYPDTPISLRSTGGDGEPAEVQVRETQHRFSQIIPPDSGPLIGSTARKLLADLSQEVDR